MIKRMSSVVAMVVVLGSSTLAMAQSAGGVKVGGDATALGLVLGNNTNAAIGRGATATTDIGTIKAGTDVGGNATALGLVLGNNTNAAIGRDATAKTSIGSIGSD